MLQGDERQPSREAAVGSADDAWVANVACASVAGAGSAASDEIATGPGARKIERGVASTGAPTSEPRLRPGAADEGSVDTPIARRTVNLCGVRFDALTEAETVEVIADQAASGAGGWVVTPNLDILRRLTIDAGFRTLCERASLRVADGMPLVWAARVQGTPLPERVAGSNLISSVSSAAARRGLRIFLLGGDPGSAEAAAEVLRGRHPNLHIAGLHCPPYGFEQDGEAMALIERLLTSAQPDIVFVALGCPKQERLIDRLRPQFPQVWWLGVGISFSFLAGHVRRAPLWMQRCGLEWVHRLVQEPGRLARRYLIDDLPFAVRLFTSAIRTRLRLAPGKS